MTLSKYNKELIFGYKILFNFYLEINFCSNFLIILLKITIVNDIIYLLYVI